MRARWLGDILAVLTGIGMLAGAALGVYLRVHLDEYPLIVERHRALFVIVQVSAVISTLAFGYWMLGDCIAQLAGATTRRRVRWPLVALCLIAPPVYYVVEYGRRPAAREALRGPRRVMAADGLAIGSVAFFVVCFPGLLGWQLAFPDSAPDVLKWNWPLFALLSFVPVGILTLWMLGDAAKMLTRSKDGTFWLVALLLLGVTGGWIYYWARYRPRVAEQSWGTGASSWARGS